MGLHSLPLSQIALSSIDMERSEIWWREGLGFLPSASTRMFRGRFLSGVVGMDKAAASTRWLVGQDEWLQIELWQYENPVPRLMDVDFAPNYVGFSRCGVWVKDYDRTLERLEAMGTVPLSDAVGGSGERRQCVRDPDGIYVELFEKDPLAGHAAAAKYECNAALRSVTITTEDLASSVEFARQGLGLLPAGQPLHTDAHETLWGMEGAVCLRKTFISDAMLLEYVNYQNPVTQRRHPHSRLNDQGILNIAFGDSQSRHGTEVMALQANKAGAISGERLDFPTGGCVYTTDPQGFSFEFMWGSPGFGHRSTGYVPCKKTNYPLLLNQRVEHAVWVDASAGAVFKVLADFESMNQWVGVDKVELIGAAKASPSGVGVERQFTTKAFTLREQVVEWFPGEGYRFRHLSGGPFVSYLGDVQLKAGKNGGTWVSCSMRFRSKISIPDFILKPLIKYRIKTALTNLRCLLDRQAVTET